MLKRVNSDRIREPEHQQETRVIKSQTIQERPMKKISLDFDSGNGNDIFTENMNNVVDLNYNSFESIEKEKELFSPLKKRHSMAKQNST
jgi:hypothetical protein